MSVVAHTADAGPETRGWFRRNWKWFVPGTLLVTIILGTIAVFGYIQVRAYRYRANPAYQAALAEVQASIEIQDRLGAPIVDSDWNPQGAIEIRNDATMGESRFNFTVSGPKGNAEIGTDARMVDGEWAIARLEAIFPEGDRISLTEQVLARQKVDTPAFDPKAAKNSTSNGKTPERSKEPGPNLDVEVPDVPPGVK
jgi:Cytochrome oxidase complex assembly protein 1